MSYGFKMASEVTDVRASGMMKEAEEDLNRIIKVTIMNLERLTNDTLLMQCIMGL